MNDFDKASSFFDIPLTVDDSVGGTTLGGGFDIDPEEVTVKATQAAAEAEFFQKKGKIPSSEFFDIDPEMVNPEISTPEDSSRDKVDISAAIPSEVLEPTFSTAVVNQAVNVSTASDVAALAGVEREKPFSVTSWAEVVSLCDPQWDFADTNERTKWLQQWPTPGDKVRSWLFGVALLLGIALGFGTGFFGAIGKSVKATGSFIWNRFLSSLVKQSNANGEKMPWFKQKINNLVSWIKGRGSKGWESFKSLPSHVAYISMINSGKFEQTEVTSLGLQEKDGELVMDVDGSTLVCQAYNFGEGCWQFLLSDGIAQYVVEVKAKFAPFSRRLKLK